MAALNIIRITTDLRSIAFEVGPSREIVLEDRLGGTTDVPSVFQRIYDDGLNQYVYYTDVAVNTAPASGDTSPNHSGSLDVAKHEIIGLE